MRNSQILFIDASAIVDDHMSGVGNYTLGIIKGFDEIAASDTTFRYRLIVPRNRAYRLEAYKLKNYDKIIATRIPYKFFKGLVRFGIPFPTDFFFGKGLYYFPAFVGWPLWLSSSATVIHDTTYLDVPEFVEEKNLRFLIKSVPVSIRNSKRLIAVSEFTRKRILETYSIESQKVGVVTPTVDREIFHKVSPDISLKTLQKYGINAGAYILAVGNLEPRKNLLKLIEAYKLFCNTQEDPPALVLVGVSAWKDEQINQVIHEVRNDGFSIYTPNSRVETSDLSAVYSGALLTAFVSLYEGFGMPVLESLTCGTPVVASNTTSVPEAGGENALYVDPTDAGAIARGFQEVISLGNKVPVEANLISPSWIDQARRTIEIIENTDEQYG